MLQNFPAQVVFVLGLQRSWKQQNYQYFWCKWFFTCLFPSQALQPPLPPQQSWRTPALGVDVRIRLCQHESFIKIPVSSLAGALRPYFSESNFTFRHKYILLVYHQLSAHCCCSHPLLLLDPQSSVPFHSQFNSDFFKAMERSHFLIYHQLFFPLHFLLISVISTPSVSAPAAGYWLVAPKPSSLSSIFSHFVILCPYISFSSSFSW